MSELVLTNDYGTTAPLVLTNDESGVAVRIAPPTPALVLELTPIVGDGGASNALKIDSTTLAFNSPSTVAMFTTGAADLIDGFEVTVHTPFDGGATMQIGIGGNTGKYAAAARIDLSTAGMCSIPNLLAPQGVEALVITYTAGAATHGAARVIAKFGTPT